MGRSSKGVFLRRLGIETRAAALKKAVAARQGRGDRRALARLTSEERTGMGRLFKAIGFRPPQARPAARIRET